MSSIINIPPNQKFGVFFSFNQITTCLIAFVQDIEKKLQQILPEIPVFILHTGDTNYWLDSKFNSINSDTYERIPRFVMTFDGSPEISEDTLTNAFNRYNYAIDVMPSDGKYPDDSYTETFNAVVRRVQLNIPVKATMVSSNFIYALRHFEVMLSIFSRENAFSYTYQGATYNAAYTNDNRQDMQFPEMDSTGNRNFIQDMTITLQSHIFVPRVETIIEYSKLANKDFKIQLDINPPIKQIKNSIDSNGNNQKQSSDIEPIESDSIILNIKYDGNNTSIDTDDQTNIQP